MGERDKETNKYAELIIQNDCHNIKSSLVNVKYRECDRAFWQIAFNLIYMW